MQKREFKLKLSFYYIAIIASVLLISLTIIITAPLSLFLKLIGIIAVSIYSIYLFKNARSIISLRYLDNGKWLIETRREAYEGELLGSSTVTGFVSILRFKKEGHFLAKSCVIFQDAVGRKVYRQLMVIVRMY